MKKQFISQAPEVVLDFRNIDSLYRGLKISDEDLKEIQASLDTLPKEGAYVDSQQYVFQPGQKLVVNTSEKTLVHKVLSAQFELVKYFNIPGLEYPVIFIYKARAVDMDTDGELSFGIGTNALAFPVRVKAVKMPLRSINFLFRSGCSKQQNEETLAQIRQIEGITSANFVKPDARNPALLRLGFAYAGDNTDIDALVESLKQIPELESVSIPAERGFTPQSDESKQE